MRALVIAAIAWLYVDGALVSALWARGKFPRPVALGAALAWPIAMPAAAFVLWAVG